MSDTLVVNEIYLSLQGESTFAGLPCVFVRLAACDLRCSYCDTAYAFVEGSKRTLAEIRAEVQRLAAPFDTHDVGVEAYCYRPTFLGGAVRMSDLSPPTIQYQPPP